MLLRQPPLLPPRSHADHEHVVKREQQSRHRRPRTGEPVEDEKRGMLAQPAIEESRAEEKHRERRQHHAKNRAPPRRLIADDALRDGNDVSKHAGTLANRARLV